MACQVFRNDTGSITSVTAPNGQESKLYKNILSVQPDPEAALKLWAQVYTPSFKEWFGDWEKKEGSEVVDDNGEPLLMFSGSGVKFDTFEKEKLFSGEGAAIYGTGFYFTDNRDTAVGYKNINNQLTKLGYEKRHLENMLKDKDRDLAYARSFLVQYNKNMILLNELHKKAGHVPYDVSESNYKEKGYTIEEFKNRELLVELEEYLMDQNMAPDYTDVHSEEQLQRLIDEFARYEKRLAQINELVRTGRNSAKLESGFVFDVFLSIKNPFLWERVATQQEIDSFNKILADKNAVVNFKYNPKSSTVRSIFKDFAFEYEYQMKKYEKGFQYTDKMKTIFADEAEWETFVNGAIDAFSTSNAEPTKLIELFEKYQDTVPGLKDFQKQFLDYLERGRENNGKVLEIQSKSNLTLGNIYNVIADNIEEKYARSQRGSVNTTHVTELLQEMGYDGVLHVTRKNYYHPTGRFEQKSGEKHYVAFEANEVKSVLNQGTFSKQTNNIYLQKEQQSSKPSNAELDSKVSKFLSSIGVNVKTLDTIRDKDGNLLDAVAKANMLNKIIEIAAGRADITTLSEEAAHFFVEMLGEQSPIYKMMYDKITGYKIYQQTVAEYKNLPMYRNQDGTVNFNKIKKEAMGKLIMAFIVKQETGEEASDKVNTVKTFWSAMWDYIKSLFKKSSGNPFADAAGQILGNDISNLDTQKDLEDEDYLQTGPVLFGKDKLLKDQDRIKLDDSLDPVTKEKKHIYNVDNKPVVDKEGKSRSVSSVYVDAWYKQRFPTDNRSDRQKNIDNLKAEQGTDLHEDMQNIIRRYFDKDGKRRDTPLAKDKVVTNDDIYQKLELYMLQLMEQYTDPGTLFLSEVKIYDPENNVAGTIDLVIIKPDGSVDIYDWKSQEVGKDQDELKWFKAPAYRVQMEAYKQILSKHYGFSKFGKIRAIPIKTTYFMTKDANGFRPTKLKDVEIGHADPTLIPTDKNYLLPVVMLYESTGDDNLDELIKKLNTIYDRLSEQKVGASEKDIKAEELNDLAKTIRDLQVRKDITSFIDSGIFEMRKYNDKLVKSTINIFNVQDAIQTMKVYAEAQDFLATEMTKLSMQIRKSKNPDEKKFLEDTMDKFLEMQGNARVVLNKLIKRRELLGDDFARGESINTLLNTEKSMDYLKRNFRSLSTLDTAALKTFYKVLRRAQSVRDTKINQMFEEMGVAQKELEEWARKKGKSGMDIYSYLLEIDSKGNWNGDFLNIYSKEYFTEKDKAIKASNMKWLRDNTDFDQAAYDAKRKEQIAMLQERYPGDGAEVKNKRDVLLVKWEEKYSNKYDFAYLNKYNTFIRPKQQWNSEKYKFMNEKGNEPLLNTYNYFQKMIRYSAELGMIDKFSSKFIPSVMKGVELSPKAIIDSMQVESDQGFGNIDNLTGQLKKEIPVYFTRDLGKGKDDGSVDYSDKSQDLFNVFGTWGKQMFNYEAMQSLEDISDALLEIERGKKSFVQNMFGRVDKTKQTDNNDTNTKVLENYINYYLYGQNTMQGVDKAIKVNGKEYSAVKGAQKVIKFMAVKTLGLNYLSGTATFVGGTANAWFQSSKRMIFTEKEWMRGMKDYSAKDEVTITAIYQLGLSLEDQSNAQLRKLSVSGVMKHANSDALMFIQRGGDRWATLPVAAAMLHTYMIDENKNLVNIRDYVKNKNNYAGFYNLSKDDQNALRKKIDKEIEELQKTKSIKATAKVENDKLILPGLTDNQENQAAFRGVVQKNLKQMIGNATRDDINQVRMTLLGQTLMQFRSWMPQMMTERFGDMSQDSDTDMWNYGKARLFLKHIIRKGALPLIKEMITGFGPNTVQVAKQRYAEFVSRLQEEGKINDPSEFMTEAEFIDMYIGNLRSMMRELMLLLSFAGLVFWSAGGDDDEKTGVQKFIHKAFKKYYNEFAFYYSPGEFMSMLKSPVPVLGLLGDTERFLEDSIGQTWGFMSDNDTRMDDNKPLKYLNKILPIAKELQSTYAMFDDDFRREFDIR